MKIETEKYKNEKEAQTVLIPFHTDKQLDYSKQIFFRGAIISCNPFIINCKRIKICPKLKQKYKFKYDINAILSDLIIYYSDAGLGSESIREYNHMGERMQKRLDPGNTKKNRKTPNDLAHFIDAMAVTSEFR